MTILPDGSTCSFKEGLGVKIASIARQEQACVPGYNHMIIIFDGYVIMIMILRMRMMMLEEKIASVARQKQACVPDIIDDGFMTNI